MSLDTAEDREWMDSPDPTPNSAPTIEPHFKYSVDSHTATELAHVIGVMLSNELGRVNPSSFFTLDEERELANMISPALLAKLANQIEWRAVQALEYNRVRQP